MKHCIFFLLAILLALPLAGQVPLPKPKDVRPEYRKEFRQAVREYNRTVSRIDTSQWDVNLGPGESVPTDVVSAEEFRAMAYTNWYRDLVSPESLAGDLVKGAKRRGVINVTDTGCDTDHPDLQKGKLPGSNYTADPCPDKHGHGTHVLGIAYLLIKPLIDAGFIEVKMSKFLNDSGQAAYGGLTGGIKEENSWMYDNYIRQGKFAVANGSWGGGTSVYTPLAAELKDGKNKGIVWIFAAGNSGQDVIFPGLLPDVSAVASLDKNLQKSSFSCFGPEVDFAAGGRDIYSTLPGGRYGSLTGTSMASPVIAATAAAAMCLWPELNAETLPAYLAKISTDIGEPGRDDLYGWGMQYLRAIIDTPPGNQPPPPDEPTCTDGKQNGKETGVDCGGPECPPCEEPEPEKPPYQKRVLPLELLGSYPINWVRATTESSIKPPSKEEAESFGVSVTVDGSLHTLGASCYDMDTYSRFHTAGTTSITITRMLVEARSETTYDWEWKALEKNAREFFSNRSIGTPGTWDVYHTGAYLLYFLDYFASQEKPGFIYQDLKPLGIEFEWEGVRVVVTRDLIDYKGPKKD